MKKFLSSFALVSVALFADLLTKYLAEKYLAVNRSFPVLGDFFKLTLVYNRGAIFGFLGEHSLYASILITNSILLIILIVLLFKIASLVKQERYQKIAEVCLLLLVAGALGNIIDRLLHQCVTDFFDFGIGKWRWYIFNVADIYLTVGGIIIFIILALENNVKKQPASEEV
jgi:signal peptidase II